MESPAGRGGPSFSDEARQLYLRLLDSRRPPRVDDCPERGLGQLLQLGLAKLEDDEVLVVAAWQALSNLTDVLHVRTRQTLSELTEVSGFLGTCTTRRDSGSLVDGGQPEPVRVIASRDELYRFIPMLPGRARHSYCSVQTSARLDDGAYQLMGLPADPEPRGGVVCRIVVDRALAADARPVMTAGIKRGEQIRCHPAPPLKFILVDSRLALLPLDETARAGAVVLNSRAIGALLACTFEHLWRESTPMSTRRTGPADLSPTEIRLLRMLADDADDGTIATVLGISDRSLRRHLAAAQDTLGVRSRPGAIAAAFRLGLVV
jgi:DNA-binding CsgD family transcriptional regulator